MTSLPAIARLAERQVLRHGPLDVDQLRDHLALAGHDRDRVEAGMRLAVVTGRLILDRDATLRIPTAENAA